MLELLTGKPVFRANSFLEFIEKIIEFTGVPSK